jgi:glycosyltransferase involved in cell wall biosynthesis
MNNNINWLIVVSDDGVFGGAEYMQLQITEYLINKNNSCTVYFLKSTRFGKWDHLANKCKLVYSPFSSYFLGFLYLIPFIIKTSIKNRIQWTFSSQTLINAMLGLMKKLGVLKKSKIVVRESTSVFKQIKGLKALRYKLAYNIGYSKVDFVIFQTELMKNDLLREFPWMNNNLKLFVLGNPINLDLVRVKSLEDSQSHLEKEFIVAAGRLVNVKGFDILIDSFNRIKNNFPNLELWILGEGVLREELQAHIHNYGLRERVKLIGHVDNPYPYFKNAKACVISSRVEGFPNVLLQMMVCNNKVISTDCAGDIKNIEGIFKCKTENIEDLSQQITNALTSNTSENRHLFDTFLEKRTFKSYMDTILNFN